MASPLDVVEGCEVTWRDGGHGPNPETGRHGSSGSPRRLRSVQVRRIAMDTFEFNRPRSGALVVKRISGRHVTVRGPDGEDILARWRGV